MKTHSSLAQIRFGLGRRLDEDLPDDPQEWLLAQLNGPGQAQYPADVAMVADALAAIKLREQLQRASKTPLAGPDNPVQQISTRDMNLEAHQWVTNPDSFRERLVIFWTNHFTVARNSPAVTALAGSFVRDAIRPNVTGSFGAMLLAVMRHPAMLSYLNNSSSIGPNSVAGLKRKNGGLNENLGRECLELHTLSPAAGYTQADVTNMARILTGWGIKPVPPDPGFVFRPNAHEPGTKLLMGREFPEGEEGGVEALSFLAAHPATARHIATQLARHFVDDNPPPVLVEQLTNRYLQTGGDLTQVTSLLVKSPLAWQGITKLRTPQDFVIAAWRAGGLGDDKIDSIPKQLQYLSQPVWNAPSPKGWSDLASDWLNPAILLHRVEIAFGVAGLAAKQDPAMVMEVALGPYVANDTRDAVLRAGSRREALALLFSSPQFWRR